MGAMSHILLTSRHTIRELAAAYLHDLEERVTAGDVGRETLFSYRSSLSVHLDALAEVPIGDLSRPLVRQWYRERSQVSPGAAKSAHARLRTMLSWAVDDGLIPENPASSLRICYQPAPGEPFSAPELAEFVRRCEVVIKERTARARNAAHREHRTAVAEILLICALTGSRSGVIRRATVEMYRPAKQALYVARSKSRKPLVIPLPRRAVEIFERRVAHHRGHLFLGRDQAVPISATALYRGFKQIGGEMVATRHPHDLRHTAATIAREEGEPLTDIMELLGHASISMTLHYSATATSSRARRVAQRLEQIGGGDA